MTTLPGYHGVLLEVDLTTGTSRPRPLDPADARAFLGGRGLGAKLLWDLLPGPGVDPLSPENPLLFLTGPFSGFPVPSASRTCVVTKSPVTAPLAPPRAHSSTITYSNMGGFFGPEIRFAGYDGLVIRGRADHPVMLVIDDDHVEIRDARKYWGMGTDAFDRTIVEDLGDRRYRTCYIGPAGENMVPFSSILNTSARAAGRGGAGCVMGSKRLKAIAIRGSKQPDVAAHKRFLTLLEQARKDLKAWPGRVNWRQYGTGSALLAASDRGIQAVRNYREGTFAGVDKIGGVTARRAVWQRDSACFVCPLACKKAGLAPHGTHAGMVHDGPEYETGTMLGANLLIDDMAGMLHAIYDADDLGLDVISAGNLVGFMMEARERKMVDAAFLGGVDLKWGDVAGVLKALPQLARREHWGAVAAQGFRALVARCGAESARFAMHVKGHPFAAWNVQNDPAMGLSYATANRGACHVNGRRFEGQNDTAMVDSTGLCLFARGGFSEELLSGLLETIGARGWTYPEYYAAGERTFLMEKLFNWREGFRQADDALPARGFEDALTLGLFKGAVMDRAAYDKRLSDYYTQRGWDPATSAPLRETARRLGVEPYFDKAVQAS